MAQITRLNVGPCIFTGISQLVSEVHMRNGSIIMVIPGVTGFPMPRHAGSRQLFIIYVSELEKDMADEEILLLVKK
mgnify:CR=1 FL=1